MAHDYRDTEAGKRRFNHPGVYIKTLDFQQEMKKHGIAWHNHFANECTIDFCCCEGDGSYKTYLPSYERASKEMLQDLIGAIPELKVNDNLKQKILSFHKAYFSID